MLTVAEALKLDVLRGAEVVAGHDGLDRVIEWVHNVGVPDAARWLKGGEFVLTTPFNIPTAPDDQADYLRAIIDRGVAALGISVGQNLRAIPAHLCAIADAHAFPLIAVPYDLYFVDIARTVNQGIAQRDVRRALAIHQALTRLVVDGGGLKDLAETLARLVQQSVSIENDQFEAFASANIAPVDEARRYTQRYGRTDPRLVRALQERGYLPQIHRTLRPVSLPRMPDVGLEMERILAPVVVHGEVYGYMWIIADERPLSDLEQMAIESGATIAALMLLRQETVQREEATQRGELLASLLQADAPAREELLTDRALRYQVDLRQPFRVLVAEATERRLTPRQIRQMTQRLDALPQVLIAGRFAGELVVLVPANADLDALSRVVLSTLIDEETGGLRVGISAEHRRVIGVAQAHHECRTALLITRRLGGARADQVVRYESLGYLHALYRAGGEALEGNPYADRLRQLRDERHADLFDTLEAYLDSGGNGVATAEALHIHRSTLNYRLARISETCAVDLSDPHTRTNLQIALKLLRLFES